jgi:hypothetical protein
MHYPTEQEVQSLIRDFEQDFGVMLPLEDARRILVLYEELCELFERHGGEGAGFEMRHREPPMLAE